MALTPGTRLGVYEVTAQIGEGGMGRVYQARDTKLNRDVALKVLPDAFASDTERLARFTREAQTLASLSHSNIAHIYGLEESGGMHALVMELVEGEDLSQRIARGAIPIEEALPIAKQIAEALEAAHEQRIIHRDLKPANIKVRADGTLKVLDFGLAKAMEPVSGAVPSMSRSPTITTPAMTQAGMILGTAAYMAPEQAEGKPVDRRADIWAFGVVLWEMLTGQRLFYADTVPLTLADVLRKEVDFTQVPEGTPPQVRELLKRCLDRDVKNRLQWIGEARVVIQRYVANPPTPDSGGPGLQPGESRSRLGRLWPAIAAVLALVAAGLAFVHFRETPSPEQILRYTIAPPEGGTVHSFAISPDGRHLAIATQVNGKRQLWLRAMDAFQAQPIPLTDDAAFPFWSPDSRYIGFFAQNKLKKVAASGGPPQLLSEAGVVGRGGSWNRDDVIVFAQGNAGGSFQRIAATGGVPVDIPTKTKGVGQRRPIFLPDGRHFLYLTVGRTADASGVYVSSLDGQENRRVLADLSEVVARPTRSGRSGYLLFVRESTLMAAPFDGASAQVLGDVFPVAEGVSLTYNATYVPATVSDNGLLIYEVSGSNNGAAANQFVWYDRSGISFDPVGTPGAILDPALSPDGKSVVFRRLTAAASDLWVRDLSRGTETKLTSDPSNNLAPFWSPTGDRLVYTSSRSGGVLNLYQKSAHGSGQDELLWPNRINDISSQWSRDGRFLVYFEVDPKNKRDLWVLPVESASADRKPIPFLRTEFDELFGQLSPDSHWMAFTSDRSGRREVYVRPFPPSEGEWPISIAGGQAPRWRADGNELFFEAANGTMMAVPVKAAAGPPASFDAGAPVALFEAHMVHNGNDSQLQYDVTADGKRFLVNTAGSPTATSPRPLSVVVNWSAAATK